MTPDHFSLVLVHRSPTMASALALLLEDSGYCDVLKVASSAVDALSAARCTSPQAVLVDPQLPEIDFGELVAELRQAAPGAQIIALTGSNDPAHLTRAIDAGVTAYLSTASEPAELIRKLRLAAEGHVLVSGPVISDLQDLVRTAGAVYVDAGESEALTERERQVVDLASKGHTNREIAEVLVLTENTVKVHLRNIYRKLDVRNRHQLTVKVLQAS